jgi:uncharacterized phage protein (TIGR02218 family)
MDATFHSIPVFKFPVDWANAVSGSWQYDLRQFTLGYGVELTDPVQNYVVQGWEFQCTFRGDTEISDIDNFMNALQGRTRPFWLPGPPAKYHIIAGLTASTFIIGEQGGFRSTGIEPGDYVWFTREGYTSLAAKVDIVTENGDGTETVHLTSGLPHDPDENWKVFKLYLVRNAEDEEHVNQVAERYQTRSYRVVEMPNDYATVESGLDEPYQPVFLYRFTATFPSGDVVWRYTSFPEDVTVDAEVWEAVGIEHGSVEHSAKLGGQTTISADYDAVQPLALLVPLQIASEVTVEILETDVSLGSPDEVFTGLVGKVEREGRKVTANCGEWGAALDQRIPNFYIQPTCNYRVYDPSTCKADKTSKTVAISATVAVGRTVTVSGGGLAGKPANWFARGWLDVGTGLNRRLLFVVDSAAAIGTTVVLTLSVALDLTLPVSGSVFPGCDGNRATCETKFNNLVNFGGCFVPEDNLAVSAITVSAGGGKK